MPFAGPTSEPAHLPRNFESSMGFDQVSPESLLSCCQFVSAGLHVCACVFLFRSPRTNCRTGMWGERRGSEQSSIPWNRRSRGTEVAPVDQELDAAGILRGKPVERANARLGGVCKPTRVFSHSARAARRRGVWGT